MALLNDQDERKWVSNRYARPQSTLKIGGGPTDSQTIARSIVARQKGQSGAQSSNINDYFMKRNQEKVRQSTRLNQEAQKKNMAADFGSKYDQMQQSARVKLQEKWKLEDEAAKAAAEQARWKAANPTSIKSQAGIAAAGASASASSGGQVYTGNAARDTVLNTAAAQLGVNYAWGGGGYGVAGSAGGLNGPGGRTVVGFDCSGLVSYALSSMGIKLPARQSQAILSSYGNKTSFSNAAPGDLVGWYSGNGYQRHIALKYDDNHIIESSPGGVRIRKVNPTGGGIFGVHLNY